MNRRRFTLSLFATTAIAGFAEHVRAQGAIPAAQYMMMANKGGLFLEDTARTAVERAQDPAVRRFARAEVVEQVTLGDRIAAVSGGMPPMAGAPAGGLIGAATAVPLGVAGAAVGVAGGLVGLAGPATSDSQKAEIAASLRALPPGPSYEAAFVDAQLTGHEEALAIHGSYARDGGDPALRRVARGALPLIRLHIAQLRRMQRGMGGGAGRPVG